jgi:lipoate-protein ligase A
MSNISYFQGQVEKLSKKVSSLEKRVVELEELREHEMGEIAKRLRATFSQLAEVQEFLWPTVDKVFPSLIREYEAIGERFKGIGPDLKRAPDDEKRRDLPSN